MIRLLLDTARAARALGVSVQTFNRMLRDGKTPSPPRPVDLRGKRMFMTSEIQDFVRQLGEVRSAK